MHVIPYIELQSAQSLNSLDCSGFMLVLEMFLKKFLFFSGLFWNCFWVQNFWQSDFYVTTFTVAPSLDSLFVIKYYFHSAKGNLNNRSSHQVTVSSNWRWMSFSKLPHLLDAFWPIIVTSDHFPVLQNEKDYETGIALFVVMLYLFRVSNQGTVCIAVPPPPPQKHHPPRPPFLGNPPPIS